MGAKSSALFSAVALGVSLAAQVPALPTTVKIHALEVLNGVSPEAHLWILEEARSVAKQPAFSVESIGSAANQRFGRKNQLTASQQDALALAVLYQVMRLDEEEYRRRTGRSLSLAAVTSASASHKASPNPGTSTHPSFASGPQADNLGDSELQILASTYAAAEALASSADRRVGCALSSVIGKI